MALVEHVTPAATDAAEIPFDAPTVVRDGLAAMGRTEDLRFAPGGRRLAIACYTRARIVLADVELVAGPTGPRIALTGLDELVSPALREPHGVEFLDDETLIVANRSGSLAVFRVPEGGSADPEPVRLLERSLGGLLDSPGSVAALRSGEVYDVLACNNWSGRLTRHVLHDDGRADEEVAAHRWLDLPDGVAISRDARWVAVSNHNTHCVLVFERAAMSPETDPVAVLRGVRYPHGLRFDEEGRRLLVADAGAPYVHMYATSLRGWRGASYPVASIRVMSEETFAAGHHNPQEGGPKGIDLHPANVLAITAECAPLQFFDLRAMDEVADGTEAASERLLAYELHVLAENARIGQMAADARAQLKAFQRTKAWRVTQPARRAYGAVRRIRASVRRRAD